MVRIVSTAGFRSQNGATFFGSLFDDMEGYADTVMEPTVDLRAYNKGRTADASNNEKRRAKRKEKRLELMKQYEEERAKRQAESGALNLTKCQFGGTAKGSRPRTGKYPKRKGKR